MLFGNENQGVLGQISEGLTTVGFVFVPLYLMNASFGLMLIAGVVSFAVGALIQSSVTVIAGFFLSLVVGCVAALLAEQLSPNYSISGQTVLILLFVGTIVGALSLKKWRPIPPNSGVSWAMIPFVLLMTQLVEQSRNWESASAFGILVNNGEDNAAWLVALSQSVINGDTVLSAASGASGGPATGVFVAASRALFALVEPNAVIANADNALVLLRMYALLGILTSIVWVTVAFTLMKTQPLIARCGFALVSALTAFAFVMGLATVGHFSAIVAVLFLSVAVFFHETLGRTNLTAKALNRTLIFLALVAAGQAWFPLTAVALFFMLVMTANAILKIVRQQINREVILKIILILLVLSIGSMAAYQKIFSTFLTNVIDIDFVIYNLTLAGGYATVSPWLVLLGFAGCLWWGFSSDSSDELSRVSLVSALIIPVVGLFTWSYFLSPYTPQYGAWKYLYMAAAVAVPWSILIFGRGLASSVKPGVLVQVPLWILLALGLFSPPFQHSFWVNTSQPAGYEWESTVVNELRENPERPVVCNNSIKDDDGQKYIAYLCSRMSLGLGGFDQEKHKVWNAANYCTVSAEQMKSEWPVEEQKNLSVILFDPTRTSSFAGCQAPVEGYPNGLLSFVDWNVVKKLSPNGDVVNIQPTKAGD
jgi:hypothetical protein